MVTPTLVGRQSTGESGMRGMEIGGKSDERGGGPEDDWGWEEDHRVRTLTGRSELTQPLLKSCPHGP